jgi:hypothetical protein
MPEIVKGEPLPPSRELTGESRFAHPPRDEYRGTERLV